MLLQIVYILDQVKALEGGDHPALQRLRPGRQAPDRGGHPPNTRRSGELMLSLPKATFLYLIMQSLHDQVREIHQLPFSRI